MTPEALIVPALRGELVSWPGDALSTLDAAVLEFAGAHGVTALLSSSPAVRQWPAALRAALARACREAAALDALRHTELARVLAALASAGVNPVIVKGQQLALTHYPKPWLRPRLDTDLLIHPDRRRAADDVLRDAGYRPATHFEGSLITHQFEYHRESPYGVTDVVDLHWRIANPHVFAGALTFDEIELDARTIRGFPGARGPCDAHALILACIHRVAHHGNSDRLIWLYDIHLLASAMTAEERGTTLHLARMKGLRSVCSAGIERARSRFGTSVPGDWIRRLQPSDGAAEPSTEFLRAGRSKVDDLLSDLRTLDGWGQRLRLLREHLFPPAAFIRHSYGVRSPMFVPFGYAHRLVTGVGKWFHRRDRGR